MQATARVSIISSSTQWTLIIHRAFEDILSKSKSSFSLNLDAMGLQSLSVAVELFRFAGVLSTLCSVMDAFKVL